ncbi:hypothetical protein BHS07_08185 [Myxococcus xanthus]|nr:hypothetical protein BHS07_08185 [Myxococcus xanthus]
MLPWRQRATRARGARRTSRATSAETVASTVTGTQPYGASTRLPLAAPMDIPMNRTALSRLRAAGSMPKTMV